MSLKFTGGAVYAVFPNIDVSTQQPMPRMNLEFAPKRRTLKWRGRRFNVPTMRVVRIGFCAPFEVKSA